MMKKISVFLIAAVFLFSFVTSAMAVRVLTYADHDPPSGMRVNSVKVWFDLIEKETNGRVKIKPLFGGAMGKAPEALKLVADGSADMAFVFPDFFPKQLQAANIFKLFPEGPNKWENILWLYDEVYKNIPAFSDELAKENQKVLYITSALPSAMCATYPLNKIDDIMGKKWRASSRWHLAYFKALGAVPVSVPWADCYMSLQTGVINGVLTDYDGMHDTKLDEAAPNIFIGMNAWFGSPFMHTINLKTWNSLSKEDQDGIMRAARIVSEKEFGRMHREDFDHILNAQKKAGAKVLFWSDADMQKWANNPAISESRQIWIKEAKDMGIKDPEGIMDKVGKIVSEAVKREKK